MDITEKTTELFNQWKKTVSDYWEYVAGSGTPTHLDHVTSELEKKKLRQEFQNRFGKEGEAHLVSVIVSKELNGGDNPENPDDFYPGLEYSLPLSMYIMRRALDTDSDKDSYDIFTNDVQAVANKNGTEINRLPTKEHVENLTAEAIENIQKVEQMPENYSTPPEEDVDIAL